MKWTWFLLLPICAVLPVSAIEKADGCTYTPPLEAQADVKFFREIGALANIETFENVLKFFKEHQSNLHQFEFRYSLKDKAHAEAFAKVLRIKAQEAHRFVPVIEDCTVLDSASSGFIRHIFIKDGPLVQEHTLIDQDRVLFIEQWVISENGVEPGRFSAFNRIVEEEGKWYFDGTYLYDEPASVEEAAQRCEMFRKTYENMAAFIEQADVNEVESKLKKV